MTNQPGETRHQPAPPETYVEAYEQEPGLVDGIKYLYARRLRLAVHFLVVFGIGTLTYLFVYLTTAKVVEGTIGLSFRGIERHEYPSGKKFSVEDFRSPDLLDKVLKETGIQNAKSSPRELAARVYITPVIPGEIQARWRKQEKDGTKREEYYPNEFKISVDIGDLTNAQRLRLFDALISGYQQRVKYEQNAALNFVASWNVSYEDLAKIYDFWDIPALFRETFRSLSAQLRMVVTESLQSQDSKYQLAFREILKDIKTWEATRLQALEAITYQGRLVKNRDLTSRRIEYRIEDLNIEIKQKSAETGEAIRLLEVLDRPKALLAGSLSNKEGQPMLDVTAMDRLIKSDYIGPVVQRVSKLQEEAKAMEAERARLQMQLALLPKSANISLEQLPPGYRELLDLLSAELKGIIGKFNRQLDEYLTATVSSLVAVRQSPIITRPGYSPTLMLAAIFCLSLFVAVLLLAIENVWRKAKELSKLERAS